MYVKPGLLKSDLWPHFQNQCIFWFRLQQFSESPNNVLRPLSEVLVGEKNEKRHLLSKMCILFN